MYYDDRFHPVHGNDVDANPIKTKGNTIDVIKSMDKHYHCVRVHIPEKNTKMKIEFYDSRGLGNPICNAVTGQRYRDKLIGSRAEDHFFKACINHKDYGPESLTLFYETPEEFERHHFTMLDDDIKNAWHQRVDM